MQHLQNLVGGGGGDQDEIAFLKTKAREGKHWSLMSSTLLEEAKLDMYSVSPVEQLIDLTRLADTLSTRSGVLRKPSNTSCNHPT